MNDTTEITSTPPPVEDPKPQVPKIARYFTREGSQFYPGIPARDLTPDEFAALGDEQKQLVDGGHVAGTRVTNEETGEAEPVRGQLYSRTRPAARKE